MPYLVLARKYRPQIFGEVVDQEHVTRTLTNAITSDRMAHAVLFCGPRGTGKTTVARILAKAMNCQEGPTPSPCNRCRSCREITGGHAADVFEIDGASNNSVEQVRDLRETVRYMPAHSAYKIYIIDEVHMLSTAAFNALLKTLEEPPEHVMFIFATTEPHKIPITIHSRCQRYEFRRIKLEAIVAHMQTLCESEKVEIDDDSLALIAREAGGSMRDALSLLDQIMACISDRVTYDQVVDLLGVVDNKQIFDLTTALLSSDISTMLEILDTIYDRGHDMKRLYADLVTHFRNLVLVKMGIDNRQTVDLPDYVVQQMADLVQNMSSAYLQQIFDLFFKQEAVVKYSNHPKLALEMIVLRLLQIKPALPIEDLIDKLDLLRHEMMLSPQPPSKSSTAVSGPKPEATVETRSENKPMTVPDEPKSSKSHTVAIESNRTTAEAKGGVDGLWQQIREKISGTNPSLAASLANSRLKKRTDQRLEIEVNANGFQLSMIKRDRSMEALKKACRETFGRDMRVDITATESKSPDVSPPQKKDENRLKNEALNHPLVSEALEIFNGKLVDVKILKEEEK